MFRLPKIISQQIDCPCCVHLCDEMGCEESVLRKEAIRIVKQEVRIRLLTNPFPSELEQKMGILVEMLEPQVRKAVLRLNMMGYITQSSGFGDTISNYQTIEGEFRIDKKVRNRLEYRGAEIHSQKNYTCIGFHPEGKTLGGIEDEWQAIVDRMPRISHEVELNNSQAANLFRNYLASKNQRPGGKG